MTKTDDDGDEAAGEMNTNTGGGRTLLSVTASDVKQYHYCPKIPYFQHVLNAPKAPYVKLERGKKEHEKLTKREKRRKGACFYDPLLDSDTAEKRFKLYLDSERLGLRGVLDYLVIIDGEHIPVEYKYGFSRNNSAYRNHRYQLMAYVLLVEDAFETTVRRGFVHYHRDRVNVALRVTDALRRHTRDTLEKIRGIIMDELEPAGTRKRGRCEDCEYRTYCGGG